MKETNTYTETVQKKEIVSLTCDCCGKVADDDNVWASDIETWTHEFGYGSRYDTDRVSIDICDDCYKKWTDTFVHPPQQNTSH